MIEKVNCNEMQLKHWVNGKSTHCHFGYGKEDYECCPDFSCCHPSLLRPRAEREQYLAGDINYRHAQQAIYLGEFLKLQGASVHH